MSRQPAFIDFHFQLTGLYCRKTQQTSVTYGSTLSDFLPSLFGQHLYGKGFNPLSFSDIFLKHYHIDFRFRFQRINLLTSRNRIPLFPTFHYTIVCKHSFPVSSKIFQSLHIGLVNQTSAVRRNIQ